MNPNRLAEGYQPNFDIDAAVGRQGELFVLNIAEALRDGTGEVKNQAAASKYGNVYIEFSCLKRGTWEPSGIETTTAETWSFVLGSPPMIAVSFPTELIRVVHEQLLREGKQKDMLRGSHPTRGTIVSVRELIPRLLAAHASTWKAAA